MAELDHMNIDGVEYDIRDAGAYRKPNGGIPKTDLSSDVQSAVDEVSVIDEKIPAQASSTNQLADKAFVNSSIATATATFRGTYNLVSDLSLTTSATEQQIATALAAKMSALSITPTNNDYAFVQIPTDDATPTEIARIDRYKYNGTSWAFEYSLNNSSFTAAQWATINSGLTSGDKTKLDALPTNSELTNLLNGKEAVANKVTSIAENSTDTQYGSAKAVYTFVMTAINAIKDWANGIFAKIDGYYETMVVGTAKNLEGQNVTEGAFFARPTGGESAELANGLAQLLSVKGRSVKYNQISPVITSSNFSPFNSLYATAVVEDGVASVTVANYEYMKYKIGVCYNTSFPIVPNNKYAVIMDVKTSLAMNFGIELNANATVLGNVTADNKFHRLKGIITAINSSTKMIVSPMSTFTENSNTYSVKNIMCINLTALGIDNLTTVAEVEAWLAANYGAMDYYPYSAGSVINVNMTGIESFKKNLLNPTTGKAEIIGAYSEVYGNYYGICGTYGTLTFKDAYGNESTITPDSDGKFELTVAGELTVANAGADCAVFLWWDGTETEYSEYGSDIAKLDITHIYGKKNGTGERVRVWPTGMPAIGDLQDYLKEEDGAVVAKRIIGTKDMGDIGWTKTSSSFNANIDIKNKQVGIVSKRYRWKSSGAWASYEDLDIGSANDGNIRCLDSTYINGDLSTFISAVRGIEIVYRLLSPETYTDLVYQGSSLFEDGTPVTLPVNYQVDNWGIENILPKNTSAILTAKPTITCKYSIDAMETIDTLEHKVENLEEGKANTQGIYPKIEAGSAQALAGKNPTERTFVSSKVGDPATVASGLATFDAIKGKSLVWKQMLRKDDLPQSSTINELVVTKNNDGTITINGTASEDTEIYKFYTNVIGGHKYLYKGCPQGGSNDTYYQRYSGINGRDTGGGALANASINASAAYVITVKSGVTLTNSKWTLQCFDLTLMFGAGNEPATVEEFEKLSPLPYYAYNAGTIVNNAATGLEVVGFNQWDEEWEVGGINNDGQPNTSTSVFRSKNFIPVFPSTTYNIYYGSYNSGGGKVLYYYFYDSEKNFIGERAYTNAKNETVTTPSDARYMKIRSGGNSAQTTYQNDICINISNPSKNGTYEPYKKSTVELNIPTLTGKKIVNGSTEGQDSVVIFSDTVGEQTVVGMKGVGTAFDSIVPDENKVMRKATKRFGVVDLGSLTWTYQTSTTNPRFYATLNGVKSTNNSRVGNGICSIFAYNSTENDVDKTFFFNSGKVYIYNSSYSDAATFKTAMSGVLLVYELAEPEEYVLDEPIQAGYEEDGGGTETRLPLDTSSAVLAPMAMQVKYPIDAQKQLANMPQDFISIASDSNFLAALGTAMGGTWTRTWDSANQKYSYSFTPNA